METKKHKLQQVQGRSPSTALQDLDWEAPPDDLSSQIEAWMSKTTRIAETVAPNTLLPALSQLDERRQTPGFRMVFIGEVGRGKSTLINGLLDRSVLPVRPIPTTAMVTSVVAGAPDRMEVYLSPGRHEVRRLGKTAWSDLIVKENSDDQLGESARIQVTLDHSWLRDTDIELIDTPGVGAFNRKCAAPVLDLLGQCDGVVLVVSATAPFSLTEQAFLEQDVIGRYVPRILVVVSKLDLIRPRERVELLAVIRERVRMISAQVPVMSACPIHDSDSLRDTLKALRAQIGEMAAKGDRRAWRSHQTARQLVDTLRHLQVVADTAKASSRLSTSQREAALKNAISALQQDDKRWESIRQSLNDKLEQHKQELKKRIQSDKYKLIETLSSDMKKASSPKAWWEEEFPDRVQIVLTSLSNEWKRDILAQISEDASWLQEEVAKSFAVTLTLTDRVEAENRAISIEFRKLSLRDTKSYTILSRVGIGAIPLACYLLQEPTGLASLVTVGVELIRDRLVESSLGQQRQIVKQELPNAVTQALSSYQDQVLARFEQLYTQLVADFEREQRTWRKARIDAIQTSNDVSNVPTWSESIKQAGILEAEIRSALPRLSELKEGVIA